MMIDRGPQLLIINFHCDVYIYIYMYFLISGLSAQNVDTSYCEQNSCCQQLVFGCGHVVSLDARKVGQRLGSVL